MDAIDRQRLSPFLAQIAATVAEVSPDAVVVTGDTVSPAQVRLLSATLRTFIPTDLPVIATLGNHEFWAKCNCPALFRVSGSNRLFACSSFLYQL